ncbi:hypothetical protein COU56_00650 [Candidatus Pacearchaeota archaeon CG10_big_fil_rev_8_21_14_0_10_31_9]|nr:MAG: hypothetical protein COU56_00650 [Candidatus Pacearchaeota archaeon CG10_big_fil_rev_8_21_14_0_10_31_9]
MVKFKVNGEEFFIRRYKKGDENYLLLMINKIYNINTALDYWNWKYKQNPAGFSIIVLLNKEGKIIGQIGHQFKKGYYYGEICPFFMGVDICLMENYRGFGLFSKLVDQIPHYHTKNPFFYYGFPVRHVLNAYRKVSKHKYYENSPIQTYYLSKKYLRFLRLFNLKKSSDNLIHISEAFQINKYDIDNLWKKKKKELEVCVVRNWEYLNWRILNCPDKMKLLIIKNGEKTIGYFSVLIRNKICYITDILILNDYVNKDTISEIEKFCFRYNSKEIRIFATDKLINKTFKDKGFLQFWLGQYIHYDGIKNSSDILHYLTYTDFDLI